MNTQRPTVTKFVHIGVVVEDLDETVRFLELLGFDCGKPTKYGGDWICARVYPIARCPRERSTATSRSSAT